MDSLIKYSAKGFEGAEKAPKKRYLIRREAWIEPDMFYSEAFKGLSSKAMWVLLRFRQKRTWLKVKGKKKKPVYNNKGIAFTYDEAVYFSISQSQFHTIIKKLVEVGFIDVDHQGGFFGRDVSKYNLSDRWRDFGKPTFKKVEKKRVLQAGLDVRSWQMRKEKNATEKRKEMTAENSIYEHAAVA